MLSDTRKRLSRILELRLFFYSDVKNKATLYPSVSTWRPEDKLAEVRRLPLNLFEKHLDVLAEKFLLRHFENLKGRDDDACLIKAIRSLRNKADITIAKADKNMGTCVLSTEDFISHGMKYISDDKSYRILTPAEFAKKVASAWRELEAVLKRHDMLTDDRGNLSSLAKSLLHRREQEPKPANLQVLFKVHKPPPMKIRAIANNFDTITTNASIYVHRCLVDVLNYIPTITRSTKMLMQELKKFTIEDDYLELATIDIANFYPSITHGEGLRRTRDFLEKLAHRRRNLILESSINHLLDVLYWVLRHNYVTFNEVIAHQIKGTAMGTNVAVVYANIVAASIEEDVVRRLSSSIKFYRRYIDDIFVIGKDIPILINELNEQSPTIRFELTSTRTDSVCFLDAEIELIDKKISSKLFEKPGNQHNYILPTSNHLPAVQINLIKTEVKRIRAICSEDKDFFDAILSFKCHLQRRKYHNSLLRIVDLLAFTADRPTEKTNKTMQTNKLCVVLEDLNKKYKFPMKRLLIVPSHVADITINGVPQPNASKHGQYISKILNESIIANKMGINIFSMLKRQKRETDNSLLNQPSRKRALEDEQDRGGETATKFARVCAPASPNPNPNPHANPSPNPSLTLANRLG